MKPVKFTERELNYIYDTVARQHWAIRAFKRKAENKGTITRILNKIRKHKEGRMREVISTTDELPF